VYYIDRQLPYLKTSVVGRSSMPTLRELRIQLGWNISKLAEEAGISRQAVNAAERGQEPYPVEQDGLAKASRT
jgi:DNA-binding XRE family transcriptional regulator